MRKMIVWAFRYSLDGLQATDAGSKKRWVRLRFRARQLARDRDARWTQLPSGRRAGQRTWEAGADARESATARSASSKVRRTLMATAAMTPVPAAAGRSARGSAQLPAA